MNPEVTFQKYPWLAKWTIGLFVAAGIAAGALSISLQESFEITRMLVLLAVAAAGARSKVTLHRGATISFLTAVVLFAVISEGPAVAVLTAVCGVTIQTWLPSRKVPLHQIVFNAGMIAVTVMLTWLTHHMLSDALPLATMSAEMTATVFASFVYFLSNSIFVSLIVAATQGVSMLQIWSGHFVYSAPSFLIAGMLALGVMGLTSANSLTLLAALLSVIGLTYYCSVRLSAELPR